MAIKIGDSVFAPTADRKRVLYEGIVTAVFPNGYSVKTDRGEVFAKEGAVEAMSSEVPTTAVLKGDKGDTGPQGPKGDKGDPGERGTDGRPGKDGKDGRDGRDGKQGKTGPRGPEGKQGKQGKQGEKGDKGETAELPDQVMKMVKLGGGLSKTRADELYAPIGASNTIIVPKTTDQTVNDSDISGPDDELIIPVGINQVWGFSGQIFFDSSVTAGLRSGWDYPSGTTIKWFTDDYPQTACYVETDEISYGGGGAGVVSSSGISGIIVSGGTAGNVTLLWAQQNKEVSDTIMKTGSHFLTYRLV